MGSHVSVPECQAKYNVTLNCTVVGRNVTINGKNSIETPFTSIGGFSKGQFPGDPDIAGIGILGVFVAVTSFAVFAGLTSLIWQVYKTYHLKAYTEEKRTERQNRTSFSDILETLVLACSDQQVFTGAAYGLTLRYWRGCTISAYHYNIVANMMLLTCATHLISVTIVRNYWKFPWLAALRVITIALIFIATGLLMTNQDADTALTFPSGVPNANETDSLLFLSAACFQNDNHSALDTFKDVTANANTFFEDNLAKSTPHNKIQGWNLYIITLLFYGAATIAEAIRLFRRGMSRPGWRANVGVKFRKCCSIGTPLRHLMQNVFLFYLALGVGISLTVTIISTQYIFNLRKWVDKSGWVQPENGQNPENDAKSFGQLVPIFSSALILFSFAQIISEKLTRRNNRKHDNEEMPSQNGTMPYFDPSSYNISPPPVPEKEKGAYITTVGISTPSLPPRVDLENQSWGSEFHFGSAHPSTPLLSNHSYSSSEATPGPQPFDSPGGHSFSPLVHQSSSPPLVPTALRTQGQAWDVSPISSRSSGTPQPRSLVGSPNLSQQSVSRPAMPSRFPARPPQGEI